MQPRILNPRAAADPVGYMDAVRRTEFGRAYKRKALGLLDLQRGHSVLDVGCGPGDEAIRFARVVGRQGRAVGIDTHDLMIEEARRRADQLGSTAEFAVVDGSDLEFLDASFDRCYADRVFQLLGDKQRAAIAEIARVLKPGGTLVACAPDPGSFLIDIGEREVTPKVLSFIGGRGWQGRELPNLLKDGGLIELSIAHCSGSDTNFQRVDSNTPLATLAKWARDAEAITERELSVWLSCLERAVARDRFFFGSTMLVVRGTKPRLDSAFLIPDGSCTEG